MLTQVGPFCVAPFKVHLEVTQVDPLYPTIFNMVFYAEIRHWVTLVSGEEAVLEGFLRAVQCMLALFYADNRLLALP